MPPKLPSLRTLMAQSGLDACLIPRSDEHLGEYVPPEAERLAWLTGFTGSAGLAVVLADRAALFVDGRYTLQARDEVDPADWELLHLIETPPPAWLAGVLPPGAKVGADPLLFSADQLARYEAKGLTLVRLPENPVDAIWAGRPTPAIRPAFAHDLRHAGESSATRRARIAAALREAGEDAAILTDPASVCWLLNIRGADVDFTPFLLAFAILRADGRVALICDPAKIPVALAAELGEEVEILPRASLAAALARLAEKRVRVDQSGSPAWFSEELTRIGAKVTAGADPCALPKACKNPIEQDGARYAHRLDAVAMIRFLHWLSRTPGQTELSAAAKLREFRLASPECVGESFATIAAAGPHGAIVHYRVSEATNRPIADGDVFLLDSGGQYPAGTTDITRTLWIGPSAPPAQLRQDYTRVLQGHLALGAIRFPEGLSGGFLDALARAPLWKAGLDYDHGTGHGVGSFLSVHEGPMGISRAARPVPLAPGMILSNEPGYYPGEYGIRIENLVLVQKIEGPARPFLGFETLTLVPYARALIDEAMLSGEERALINAYHARVLSEIGPWLAGEDLGWLEKACAGL